MPNLPYLIDTNVFLRIVPKTDPDRAIALSALRKLIENDAELYYTTQVLAEFWTVCTRPPTARGGYGLSPTKTERKIRMIERYCRFVPETVASHDEWRRLIVAHAIQGVQAHDARLVAVMKTYGITHLLTFEKGNFTRFQGITVVAPSDV
jgi:predicted nucleic acid-binding protein